MCLFMEMKIDEVRRLVPAGGVFRTGHLLAGQADPAGLRRQLDRWVKKGRVRQLRRGVYQLEPLPGVEPAHPFVVANALQRSSYVSLQSVLSLAGMIPEHVPVTTSVGTDRPVIHDTPLGRFQFRHVSTARFWGFVELEVARDQFARVATPAKALVDLLYLTPHSDNRDYLEELRMEPPDDFDPGELVSTAQRMGSAKVCRAVERLREIWRAG